MAGRLQNVKGDRLMGQREDWWWTGKPPQVRVCPGVGADGKISSLPLLDLSQCTRQEVLDYFDNAWTLTEVLFSALQGEEAFYLPPYHQLRYPFIFYYGHPAVFYINKLCLARILEAPLNEYFEQLFAVGVDEMPWDDMSKNKMDWPSFKEVYEYRQQVYQTVRHIIETHSGFDTLPITQDSPLWAVLMGIEHDRIHLETSSVLMREFPLSWLRRPEQWLDNHPSARVSEKRGGETIRQTRRREDAETRRIEISLTPANGENLPELEPLSGIDYPVNEMVAMPTDTVILGKPSDWPSYGWDSAYGNRQVQVDSFQVSKYLISNGEFYQFVKADGYTQQHYWTEEGWRWRTLCNPKWPTFWVADEPVDSHQYKLRTCFEIIDMPWSWPVVVNYHEAKAYCVWRTEQDGSQIPYRVMTEAEHHRMRDPLLKSLGDRAAMAQDPVMNASGHDMASSQGVNLNLAYPCEIPVDALRPNSKGFHDIFGNLWQWCEDDSNPLPGFKTHYLYEDFSRPTFDGQHKMVMGCSFISTGEDASMWERFNIRPHFFQHAGFRLVRSEDGNPVKTLLRVC